MPTPKIPISPTKGEQKQGCCQDPENHYNSSKEARGTPKNQEKEDKKGILQKSFGEEQ